MLRYAALYNHRLPPSALKSKTPLQVATKDGHQLSTHSYVISDHVIFQHVTPNG